MNAHAARPPSPFLRQIFFGPRRLRAGWRLILFVVLVVAAEMGVKFGLTASGVKLPQGFSAAGTVAGEGISFVLLAALTWTMARLESRPMAAYGLPPRGALGRRPWIGFAWGFLAVGLVVLPVALLGGLHYSGWNFRGPALLAMSALWLLGMWLVGLAEEVGFRGFMLRTLSDGVGFWPASILLSLGFGAVHYFGKPYETWVDFASVSLIALFLCWSLRRTGDLWWAIGFHAGFDFAQLSLFAGPNSGNDGRPIADALLIPHWHGPDWLTGGKLGLEASVFVFPVIALCFLVFGRVYRQVKFPTMEA